jgi:N-acetyl-gamma-glutamyl-phosphate reductase
MPAQYDAMSIRAAIIGPTGYTGLYLIQLLLRHPSAKITYLASHRGELPNVNEEFPQLLGRLPESVAVCKPIEPEALAQQADVVFLGLPHRAAMEYVPPLLDAGLRVIDLSADYRLKNTATYEEYYGHAHSDTGNLEEAVYGLPEVYRDKIPGAMLVANPGCYPTAATLAIGPLLARSLVKPRNIVINATSGVTGAGRKPAPHLHFPEANESFAAYGEVGGHRHQPEIEQTLSAIAGQHTPVLFVPHLLPIDRGILETIYLEPASADVTEDELFEALEQAYDEEPFVRVRQDLPNVKHVRDTNFCDVTVRMVPARGGNDARVVVFSAIDNMIKGASGQAIQNMNLVFELDETMGLL